MERGFFSSILPIINNIDTKWQVVGQALRDYDGYNHPLTANMCGSMPISDSTWKNLYFHDWFAFNGTLNSNGTLNNSTSGSDYYNSNKPVVWLEALFDNLWTDRSGERLMAYTAYLFGWGGFGYGVDGVWNSIYDCSPGSTPDDRLWHELPRVVQRTIPRERQ